MKNEFTPYDRALKLKQLGFDEPCFVLYKASNSNQLAYAPHGITTNSQLSQGDPNNIAAPLFQQAFRWFREEYNLFGCIDLQVCTPPHWFLRIDEISKNDYIFHSEDENYRFNTYEEAKLACIDKLIEIVESKQE